MSDCKRIFFKHKKILSALLLIFAVALLFWTVNTPALVGVSASDRQLPVYCVQRDDKVVAISFDAAWGNEDTQKLIDILNHYKVNATFFVVGDWVDRYPESVKALSDNGNEVMNHSSSHAHFSQLTEEQIVSDIRACSEKIEAVTGVEPTLFRCPYGEYDDHVIRAIRGMGMEPIQWDVDSLDWKGHLSRRDQPEGAAESEAGQHRALSQRRRAHARGPAHHSGKPDRGRLHRRPHLADPAGWRDLYRQHRYAVQAVEKPALPRDRKRGFSYFGIQLSARLKPFFMCSLALSST